MAGTLIDPGPSVAEAVKAVCTGRLFPAGSYRDVYHLPGSKWVYKVDIPHSWTNRGGNKDEYAAYLELKDNLPNSIKIPEMHLLDNGMLAAQFIDGESPSANCGRYYHDCQDQENCFWTEYGPSIHEVTRDGHFQNVIVSREGDVYVIDLGLDSPSDDSL